MAVHPLENAWSRSHRLVVVVAAGSTGMTGASGLCV
jgi:hypothetical protein